MNYDIPHDKPTRAPLKRTLPICCHDCGTSLVGFYSPKSKTPLHIECPKCSRHYDKLITPPASVAQPR